MPKFKNTSGKELSILANGRRISIPAGSIIEGPDHFRNYGALKLVTEADYDSYVKHMPNYIKANPMDKLRAFINPNSNSTEYIQRVEPREVLENNRSAALSAINYVSQYPTNGHQPVYVFISGSNPNQQKIKIQSLSTYKNIVFLDNVLESDLSNVAGDVVIKVPDNVFIDFDFIELIAKYSFNNMIRLPKPFIVTEVNKNIIVNNILENKISRTKVNLSIATLSHNKEQYINFLTDLSKQQTGFTFEVIALPNFNKEFTSCAEPLNIGIELANGAVVNLCHQDLRVNTSWIEAIITHTITLDKNNVKWGVLGMAGAFKTSKGSTPDIDGNVLYLSDMSPSKHTFAAIYRQIYGNKKEVQTIDELALIMKKDSPFRFDSNTFNHFHFYGADICLSAMSMGYKNFAIDADCLHLSDGQGNLSGGHTDIFIEQSIKLFKKWSSKFPYFKTTTATFLFKENAIVSTIFMIINQKNGNKNLPEVIKVS